MTKTRVLLADDHAVLRAGLRMLINAQSDLEVVGEAADCHETLLQTRALRPDVLTLDLTMPGGNSIKIIERLRPIAGELLVTTNHPQDYGFLRLPLLADLKPGRGALGGLYTALYSAKFSLVAVAACDMPFASAPLFTAAADIASEENADLVIARTGEGYEPLHAVYRRDSCLGAVEAAIAADKWRMDSWFTNVRLRVLSADEILKFDPQGLAFSNVNTPDEFAQAEARAESLG